MYVLFSEGKYITFPLFGPLCVYSLRTDYYDIGCVTWYRPYLWLLFITNYSSRCVLLFLFPIYWYYSFRGHSIVIYSDDDWLLLLFSWYWFNVIIVLIIVCDHYLLHSDDISDGIEGLVFGNVKFIHLFFSYSILYIVIHLVLLIRYWYSTWLLLLLMLLLPVTDIDYIVCDIVVIVIDDTCCWWRVIVNVIIIYCYSWWHWLVHYSFKLLTLPIVTWYWRGNRYWWRYWSICHCWWLLSHTVLRWLPHCCYCWCWLLFIWPIVLFTIVIRLFLEVHLIILDYSCWYCVVPWLVFPFIILIYYLFPHCCSQAIGICYCSTFILRCCYWLILILLLMPVTGIVGILLVLCYLLMIYSVIVSIPLLILMTTIVIIILHFYTIPYSCYWYLLLLFNVYIRMLCDILFNDIQYCYYTLLFQLLCQYYSSVLLFIEGLWPIGFEYCWYNSIIVLLDDWYLLIFCDTIDSCWYLNSDLFSYFWFGRLSHCCYICTTVVI